MNYLAHAYLSFDQPDILVGNMISDFVKGKKKFDFPPSIQRGIAIHRAIDEFTDSHSCTKEARKFFQPSYGLYSSVFMDVVYDHFLAIDPAEFNDASLLSFSLKTYGILDDYNVHFPQRFAMLYPYMKKYNWLYNYKNLSGIQRSFEGISHRALYISESITAFNILRDNYTDLQGLYKVFFPALKAFTIENL